jgi:hypothetical protein
MNNDFNLLPEKIKRHITNIIKYSSLPLNNESIRKMAQLWLEKEKIFQEEIAKFGFIEVDFIQIDNKCGAIIMTYSGSLLKISPEIDGERRVQYTSIGLRKDVPEEIIIDEVKLAYDIIKDETIDFISDKIKTTSPVYKIGVYKNNTSPENQIDAIDKATKYITDNFLTLNKEHLEDKL